MEKEGVGGNSEGEWDDGAARNNGMKHMKHGKARITKGID